MQQVKLDYYRILQVHFEAESEVIEAAYRRLMRKYHPDVLNSFQREVLETKIKVQEINEAYEVLSDVYKRAQYDKMLREHNNIASFQTFSVTEDLYNHLDRVEKRIYPGKCTKTKQSFQIHLACRKDSTDLFRVIGFSEIDKLAAQKLPPPKRQGTFVQRLFERISHQQNNNDNQTKANIPSDQELLKMFDGGLVLDFGKIDWAGFHCPVCEGEFTFPDGTLSSWTICGKCSRVSCAGGIKKTPFGGVTICPWCGSKRQITYHVRTGEKANKSVRGILSRVHIGIQNNELTIPSMENEKRLPPSE